MIPHYRVDLYNLLGQHCSLTIAHTGKVIGSSHFQEVSLNETALGPLKRYQGQIQLAEFSKIIISLNLRLLNLYQYLLRSKKNQKIILFGIGVSASYNTNYDSSWLHAFLVSRLIRIADAAIFYDNYPRIKYIAKGVNPNKLFVAYNTVSDRFLQSIDRSRQHLLFLGSLYKQKGIDELIDAYVGALAINPDIPNLLIVGDGPERAALEALVDSLELSERVTFTGEITEELSLGKILAASQACISPGQGGLTIQKAHSYGVPFITSSNPITGGEISSIIDGVTGFYYDGSVESLTKLIIKIQKIDLERIAENCRLFYERYRSPQIWLNGFINALQYTN